MMLIRRSSNTLPNTVITAKSMENCLDDFDSPYAKMSISTTVLLLILCILVGSYYYIQLMKEPDFKPADGSRILVQSTHGMYYICAGLIHTLDHLILLRMIQARTLLARNLSSTLVLWESIQREFQSKLITRLVQQNNTIA